MQDDELWQSQFLHVIMQMHQELSCRQTISYAYWNN